MAIRLTICTYDRIDFRVLGVDIEEESKLDSFGDFPETNREVLGPSEDLLSQSLSSTDRSELNAVNLLEVAIQSDKALHGTSLWLVIIFIKVDRHHLRSLCHVGSSTELVDVADSQSSSESDKIGVLRVGGADEVFFNVLDADLLQQCERLRVFNSVNRYLIVEADCNRILESLLVLDVVGRQTPEGEDEVDLVWVVAHQVEHNVLSVKLHFEYVSCRSCFFIWSLLDMRVVRLIHVTHF